VQPCQHSNKQLQEQPPCQCAQRHKPGCCEHAVAHKQRSLAPQRHSRRAAPRVTHQQARNAQIVQACHCRPLGRQRPAQLVVGQGPVCMQGARTPALKRPHVSPTRCLRLPARDAQQLTSTRLSHKQAPTMAGLPSTHEHACRCSTSQQHRCAGNTQVQPCQHSNKQQQERPLHPAPGSLSAAAGTTLAHSARSATSLAAASMQWRTNREARRRTGTAAPQCPAQHSNNHHATHSSLKLVIEDHWDGSDPLSLLFSRDLCACKGHVHKPPAGHASDQAGAYACQQGTHSTAQALGCRTSKHKQWHGCQARNAGAAPRNSTTTVRQTPRGNKQLQKHPPRHTAQRA
jgi:hypothetical protein